VSCSSTEVEYRSLSLATVEMLWPQMLLKELRLSSFLAPWCDNSGALPLASNPVFHSRTKHIEVDIHFVREKVVNRDLQLCYLSALEQVVSVISKILFNN
jgi:hypothetical protein